MSYLEKYRDDFGDVHTLQRVLEESRRLAQEEKEEKEEKEADEKQQALWDSYPRIDQPEELTIALFPHQRVTVYNMEHLERVRKVARDANSYFMTDFGILGDIPGYGKSLSIVTLLLRDQMPWDISNLSEQSDVYSYNGCLRVVQRQIRTRIRPNLILASPTLMEQWKTYFGFVRPNRLKIAEIVRSRDLEDFQPNQYDVVLCSSTRYNELIEKVGSRVVWRRFIFDEAASTHIAGMRSIHAGFVWFVSATYPQLVYATGGGNHYLKHFFSRIDFTILPHFVIRNDIQFVKHSFRMPGVQHVDVRCLNPRMLGILSHYIDSETRLMISAGDIRGALARLGGGTTTENNLFNMVAKRQQEKLSQARFSHQFWLTRGSQKEIEMWATRVADIEKAISELEEKYKTALSDNCSICYSEIEDPVLLPCCQNIFCGGCVMKWLESSKTCPMCRSNVVVKELVYIHKGSTPIEPQEEKKEEALRPKHKKVIDLISRGEGRKFLVCSMYDESFSTIRRELEENGMDYVEISGTKKSRDSKLRKFREGNVNVIFLNSRFNGAGINLEMVSDIILYHEMPSDVQEQVIGRALRIGRKGEVTVHHLVY